ncbi:1D-myo-inositol 2-acetamido-2-deoxy-alpha-D-glucopyranoside deacetylase, partial [Bienertia sinuspersici]
MSKISDAKEMIDWEEKPLLSPGTSRESPKPKYGKTDRPLLFKHPTYGIADFELQQLNRRLKRLEDQRFLSRGHEITNESAEESRVLWEIRDKIDSMQVVITCWKTKKPSPPVDRSRGYFKE